MVCPCGHFECGLSRSEHFLFYFFFFAALIAAFFIRFISLSSGHPLYEAGCPKFLQLMQYGTVCLVGSPCCESIPLVCVGRCILRNGLGCN